MSAQGVLAVMHTPAMCSAVAGSDRLSADMGGRGSYSKAFKCPDCGRRGRFNTNFLGSQHVICDGGKFRKVADRLADLRAAGVDLHREVSR